MTTIAQRKRGRPSRPPVLLFAAWELVYIEAYLRTPWSRTRRKPSILLACKRVIQRHPKLEFREWSPPLDGNIVNAEELRTDRPRIFPIVTADRLRKWYLAFEAEVMPSLDAATPLGQMVDRVRSMAEDPRERERWSQMRERQRRFANLKRDLENQRRAVTSADLDGVFKTNAGI